MLLELFCLFHTQVKRRESKVGSEALMEEKSLSYGAKAAAGKDLSEQLVCCAQQSHRCSPSTAGHEAAWDALLGLGDLNPVFIIELDTTTTVGQLFFIKNKEAAQHSSRNTLIMTNLCIPSSCLLLCTFPTASEKKDRIWMWKWLKCHSERGDWGLDSLPSYTARIFVSLLHLCSK